MEEDRLDISDLQQIIHNLVTFIAIEGKEYVQEDHKRAYVKSYVYLLAKIVHRINEEEQFSVTEDIAKDISRYLK
ncbi:hypothetical protein GCM10022393_41930 [Aquimarina addita]|uniref:Phage protein n=1 Tax=Aquimarina addita TaxID=870485 RepID=A0ABP6UW73_9FLAO